MRLVRQWAAKYGINEPIEKSEKKKKKMKVKRNGKYIHFGHTDYEDFSTHCKRAAGIRDTA